MDLFIEREDLAPAFSTNHKLTDQQKDIVKWVVDDLGHGVAIARAGTGKTYILILSSRYMVGSVAMLMFNKSVCDEAKIKLANEGLSHVWATTFHGAGWRALLKSFPRVKLSGTSGAPHKWDLIIRKLNIPVIYISFVKKAVGFAKQRAFGVLSDIDDTAIWHQLVEDYDLDSTISSDYMELGIKTKVEVIKTAIEWSIKAYHLSIEMLPAIADHDDQIFGPLIFNTDMGEYNWVVVDEAQDTSLARRLLAEKMLRPGGRTLWVGDDRQAIYAFAGADNDAIDQIIKHFKAKVMKLTVTFRCPKVAVKLAKELVPDYECHEDNNEGIHENIETDKFFKEIASTLPATNSMILCRNTAPLVKAALRLISLGISCYVEGKDIGADISQLVNRWRVKSLDAFREKLNDYLANRLTKLIAEGKDRQAESLEDRINTVFALMEGLPRNSSIGDLKRRVDDMFQQTPPGVRPNRLRLMTLHRCKGLEEKVVVFYGRERLPSGYARSQSDIKQELNLIYVGLTRVQERLIDVRVL